MAKKAAAPRITTKDIDTYFALDAKRKAFNRQAKDIEKQQDEIEDKLLAYTRVHGGDAKSTETCGARLAIITKNGAVPWKEEFIRTQGLKAAEKLIAAQPTKEALQVERL